MQETKTELSVQTPMNSERPRPRWRIRLAVISLAGVILAALAAHSLTPVVPGRAETLPARVKWYLSHNQAQADLRTLGSVVTYLVQPERDLPALTNQAGLPLTANPKTDVPKS